MYPRLVALLREEDNYIQLNSFLEVIKVNAMRKRDVNIMKNIALFLLLMTPLFAFSQSKKMRKAQQYMEVLNYDKAIETYHRIIQKTENPRAKIGLAEAYLKKKDYGNARIWYDIITQLPEARAVDFLNSGLLYLRAGECDKAQVNFDLFLKLKPYDSRKEQLSSACQYYESLLTKNTNRLTIDSLPINTSLPELGATFYQNGIVYAAVRPDKNHGQRSFDLYYAPFYFSDTSGLRLGKEEEFAPSLNTLLSNEAVASFDRKGATIFFTRNQKSAEVKNIYKLEILTARHLKSGVWSKPKKLSFVQKEYSYAHPALSPSGTQLFFASNMPGGFGGVDIYVSNYENNEWSKPINLGPEINTEGDELYPYFRKDGYLFFASDGHVGLGGQDIFKSKQNSNGEWEKVENCGAIINSAFDDFAISFSENFDYGFFSSNRDSGKGADDIYFFRRLDVPQDQLFLLVNAVSEQPIREPITCLNLCDSTSIEISNSFHKRDISGCCKIALNSPNFEYKTIDLCESELLDKDTIRISLTPNHSILKGIVRDRKTAQPIVGAIVSIQSSCESNYSFHTDEAGRFEVRLTPGCCYTGAVEWHGNQLPIEDTYCVEEGALQNYDLEVLYDEQFFESEKIQLNEKISNVFEISQSTEKGAREEVHFLLDVYYDSGRASVRKSAIPELRKLLTLLQENPAISIEIGSHTDAVGTKEANLKLSQRRANAIKVWLVKKGIDAERIIAIGYGESSPVNHCVDGVKCSESELQLNRRTEFKLLTATVSSSR